MNAKKIAEENKILQYKVGSNLYGTALPTSDIDYSGVFMPSDNMVYGFERVGEVDLSIKSKRDDGKNDENAVDLILYEFRKFIKLALDNNPNILEQLFVKDVDHINYYGQELLKHAHLFPHKGLKQKFLGYAFSQKHKMIIRTENYSSLINVQEWLNNYINNVEDGKKLLVEVLGENQLSHFFCCKGDNILIGDLTFQKHFMLRKVKKIIDERLSKVTHRKNLLSKYGYDTKFGSHLVRLMLEGKELLTTGRIEFPLKERQLLTDIKLGKYNMIDVLKMAEEYEYDIENYCEKTKLPSRPRYNEVQDFTKKMLKLWLH